MLGKIIKNEFKATSKLFGLLFGGIFILTILTKFCVYIPFDNVIFEILSGLLAIAYFVSVFGAAFFAFILMIIRFYRHMLKDEGYLTHTLPVRTWEHLVGKLITNLVWMIATVTVSLSSVAFFAFVGEDNFVGVLKFFNEAIKVIEDNPKLILLIVEVIVLLIIQFIVTMLNIYAAFSLGQLFSKHKIAGTVLFYFVLNYALGAITSVGMYFIPGFINNMDKIDRLSTSSTTADEAMTLFSSTMSQFFLVIILMNIVLGVIYFVITNFMLSKKLNLE